MSGSARSMFLVLLLAVLASWGASPEMTRAASKAAIPPPAKKDMCAGVFSGSISYDHDRYHWFCSGTQSARAGKSATFSLQCGPGKLDKRKKYSYWVSSPALKLTKAAWDPSYAELDLTFHNGSRKQQTFEYWESCLGSS